MDLKKEIANYIDQLSLVLNSLKSKTTDRLLTEEKESLQKIIGRMEGIRDTMPEVEITVKQK